MSLEIREDVITSNNKDVYGDELNDIGTKLEWFKDQKIGVIFHFGLYTEGRMCESWPLVEEADWARDNLPLSWRGLSNQEFRRNYWDLINKFNPFKLNTDKWSEICLKAGIKYALFTTKHHDGFNLYNTRYSSFKISNSNCPWHANKNVDIFNSFCKSFKDKKISVGAYYSKADWYSPFYWIPNNPLKSNTANYNPAKEPFIWKKYNEFVMNQLEEICDNYDKLDILWLDGGWVNKENNEYLDMPRLCEIAKKNNSDMLIVDRTVGGKYENYVTPEQEIPNVEDIPKKAWESGITLSQNWGYTEADIYKSEENLLDSILQVISLGGNILLGVGPDPDGELPKLAEERLLFLGNWLSIYKDAIYETRPLPKIYNKKGIYFTRKENNIYIIFSKKMGNSTIYISDIIDDLKVDIKKITEIKNGNPIKIDRGKIILPGTVDFYSVLKITLNEPLCYT